MHQSKELRFAIATAKKAGQILMKHYGKVGYELKGKRSLVTKADTKSEKFIISQIKKKFPMYAVFAEESGTSGDSDFVWFIDPLDGTANFAHSFPHFCVSIALAHKNKLLIGAVYDPYSEDMFYAEKGKRAFLQRKKERKRISVSDVDKLEDAFIGFDFGGDNAVITRMKGILNELALLSQGTRVSNAAALDISYVACGRLDADFEGIVNPWDIAAAGLILEEAGGVLTKFGGSPWDLKSRAVIASNGKIHKHLLNAIKDVI